MKFKYLLLFLFLTPFLNAQIENIPTFSPIYEFLKKQQVKGIIPEYDDAVLPLSKKKVIYWIERVEKSEILSIQEKQYLEGLKNNLHLTENKPINIFDDFPSEFLGLFNNGVLYSYRDQEKNIIVEPLLSSTFLVQDFSKRNAVLLNAGLAGYGSYQDWLGYYFRATNGFVAGDRETALTQKEIKQSFAFNDTKINNYDGSEGYLRLEKGIVSFQYGRERLLAGAGYTERLLLSDNAQQYDFIRLNVEDNIFNFNFIHGWLVQPAIRYLDGIMEIREKEAKYVALSRLGLNLLPGMKLGLTQIMIYGNRPFELAYLSPILFWESAQRSLNDIDNSLMSIDLRYLITNGLEFSGTFLLDDLEFSFFIPKNWNKIENRTAMEAGIYLGSPILPEKLSMRLTYTQVRPYTFSHTGKGEALSYTNNSYNLGTSLNPNSIGIRVGVNYLFSSKLLVELNFSHILHGKNEYDSEGNLIKNYGGDIYEPADYFSDRYAYILGGVRNKYFDAELSAIYYITDSFTAHMTLSLGEREDQLQKRREELATIAFRIRY